MTRSVPRCRCDCGYRCGGPGRCVLLIMDCLANNDGNHYVRDCDHVWDGDGETTEHEGGSKSWSRTCSACDVSAMTHDEWCGP